MTQRQESRALADAEQVAEAAQPGRKCMGLTKRSRANVVGPSPGVFSTNIPRGGWVVCATTGSMHADRVKTLLLFGGAPSSVHRKAVIHTR